MVVIVLVAAAYALVLLPPVQEWLGWHLAQWAGQLRTWLNPPEEVAFSRVVDEMPTPLPTITAAAPQDTPEESAEDESEFPPVPVLVNLDGTTYFSQHNRWNYCGPANLAMQLSFWGWEGTHDDVARVVKTFNKDKNVMPYELAEYAREQAGLGAIVRVGGNIELLKRLIANGFPVVVEKGPRFRDINYRVTWMGHYQTLTGYNDHKAVFIAQDSYIQPDYEQPYEELIQQWRSFNYTYIVVYPQHLQNDVLNLLGRDASEAENYKAAAELAASEIYKLEGVDQFFAWYNYGTNLAYLRDYNGAANAYDQAFALYDDLPSDPAIVPYRILWYQTGPYLAYFYTGRYQDVIELATNNSIEMVRDDEPALEESYYWRGKARIAIGDREGAIEDFMTCLQYHVDFEPCVEALNDQGIFLYQTEVK